MHLLYCILYRFPRKYLSYSSYFLPFVLFYALRENQNFHRRLCAVIQSLRTRIIFCTQKNVSFMQIIFYENRIFRHSVLCFIYWYGFSVLLYYSVGFLSSHKIANTVIKQRLRKHQSSNKNDEQWLFLIFFPFCVSLHACS